ncbi:ABC transporter permease [Actinacidiphila glaucinigra]|uniref:ABC transporter permease n=1 Tax=Actinacidiphila glaucinigra TaxID=235986 RepID=UPI002E35B5E4|nr:FtsX-like permease family protein [Actinacidiphila glaucinigra]
MLRATLRSFLAHKGRLLLSALAVLLSVAFVTGSMIFSDTVNRTFDRLFASTSADVTVGPPEAFADDQQFASGQVRTLPASLLDRVKAVPGVADARIDVTVHNTTVVDAEGRPVEPTTGALTVATDWSGNPRSPVRLTSGHAPHGPDEALIDADTAAKRDLGIGDRLRVLAQPGAFPVRLVGIATFTTTNPGAALLFVDTPTSQTRLLGRTGVATSVQADAAPGVSDDVLKKRISAALGPGYTYTTQAEQAKSAVESLATFLDVIKYVMLGFAGVAVLVGVFLIVNTYSMLIAQRTRELGLLRALGADRGQVRRSVLVEALLLGVVGSATGLVCGVGLATGLFQLLGVFGMNIDAAEMVIRARVPVAAFAVGLLVTLVAAYLPARRASRVSPMAALSDAEVAGAGRNLRSRAVGGAVATLVAAGALTGAVVAGSTGDAATFLGAGIGLSLIAAVVVGPLLVRPVIRVLGGAFPRVFGPVGRMSQRNALRNPRRTGATAGALMIGLALVTGMSIAGSSMASSFDQEIDRALGADYVVQGTHFAPFTPEITERVRKVRGAGEVTPVRYVSVLMTLPGGRTAKLTGTAIGPGADRALNLDYAAGDTARALARDSLSLSATYAAHHGLRVGSRVPVRFVDGRSATFTLRALTTSQSTLLGDDATLTMGLATAERFLPGGQDAALYVNAAPGTDKPTLRANLERALTPYPQVEVRDQADYKELVRTQISVLLNLVYALLGLAIVIAVLGVVNTLALSVIERTREIGLLRAIGLSRLQLRRMIRLESVVIALFGAVLGLTLGLVWGVVTHEVLALEGMRAFAVPWTTVGAVMAGSVVVGLVAALLPALRASRMNVLAAIAHE